MLKCDTQNVTKYARNDSFIKKIAMKMVLLPSKRVKMKAFEGWRCFFARMSFFMLKSDTQNVTKYARNDRFIKKKRFFCSLNELKRTFF